MNVEITVFHNDHRAYETTEEARHSTPEGEPCGPFMGTSCERCKYTESYTATVSTKQAELYVNPLDVIEALWVHDQMETSPTGFTVEGGRDPKAQRSLSMGDVVRYGDDSFLVCETVGWKTLDGAPADIATKRPDESIDDLSVCVDCAMLIANGETPEDNPEFSLKAEWDGWHLYIGDEVSEFVKAPCDGCGSHLAGSRMDAGAFKVISA